MEQKMNYTEVLIVENVQSYENFLIRLTSINGFYIIPLVSLVGFVLNLTSLIILLHPNFKQKPQFRYLILKIAMEMLASLIFIGFQNYLLSVIETFLQRKQVSTNSYAFQLVRFIVYKYLAYVFYVWSGVNEIMLTYDRYLVLKNENNWFNKKGAFKINVVVAVLVCSLVNLPNFFAYKLKQTSINTDSYTLELNEFGRSAFFSLYMLIVIGASNLIANLIITPLMIKVAIEYKKFIKKKLQSTCQLTRLQTLKKKREYIKFNKMTLTLILMFVVLRSVDLMVNFMYRILVVTKIPGFYWIVYVENFFYFLAALYFSSNFFVLIIFNRVFRKSFKKTFLFFKSQ